MSLFFLGKAISVTLTGAYLETRFVPATLSSSNPPLGLSPWFGLAPGILTFVGFWAFTHGLSVGRARQKAIEDAKKDGEKEVDERYGLPNLYAQGTSKHARIFNAIQRSHQQIFETYTLATLAGITAAIQYPIFAAVSCLVYAAGRISFSLNYANSQGDASKRYSSKIARFLWYAMINNTFLAFLSCANIVVGKKLV